jgi:serine/threonine-protein kinase
MNPRDSVVRTVAVDDARPEPSRRCRVARKCTSSTQFRGEIGHLLLGRLRAVTLLALVPSALFLLRNLTGGQPHTRTAAIDLWLQVGITSLLTLFAVVLWRWPGVSLSVLRKLELSLFGMMVVFFCWLQLHLFDHPDLLEGTRELSKAAATRLLIGHSAIRWFFLIVIYGVFIPNTARRCAAFAGLTAVAPLLLTPVSAMIYGQTNGGMLGGFIDLTILMLTSYAVAVFGSYRFHFLQEQAFQAQQLGQYRLKMRLGSGGMGEVYLAEHVLLRRPCAIKLIRPEQTRDPNVLQRFEREVQAMAKLTHWNTVEVYDYGRADDGTFYYAMEYLPGPNLEQLVTRHGPLPPERAVHLLRQVCWALCEAHATGLLHRDIKPSNIIVCTRGGVHDVAKLLDFGLVQGVGLQMEASRLTVEGTVLGSPPFMAPEQAAGRTDLDARTDIYSLGGVAYFLLTGQPPFTRDTAMEMLLAHAYEPVVPPTELQPAIPADLQEVILRCLSKKPAGRYENVEDLEKALAACAAADHWSEDQAMAWWASVDGRSETFAQVGTMTPTPP